MRSLIQTNEARTEKVPHFLFTILSPEKNRPQTKKPQLCTEFAFGEGSEEKGRGENSCVCRLLGDLTCQTISGLPASPWDLHRCYTANVIGAVMNLVSMRRTACEKRWKEWIHSAHDRWKRFGGKRNRESREEIWNPPSIVEENHACERNLSRRGRAWCNFQLLANKMSAQGNYRSLMEYANRRSLLTIAPSNRWVSHLFVCRK